MDKTISISLGGFSFIIDDGAYIELKNYLNEIKSSLKDIKGVDDILEDVELRIAELLRERTKLREVVNAEDITHVIEIMGSPEQYIDEDDVQNDYKSTGTGFEKTEKKKLFRDTEDKVISGVSSGLAHYLGLDPWAVRAVWLILGVLGVFTAGVSLGMVLFIYSFLWILIPQAKTTSEIFQMYGKPANFDSIKKNVINTSEEVIGATANLTKKLSFLVQILFKAFLYFVGFITILIGLSFVFTSFTLFILSVFNKFPTNIFEYTTDVWWINFVIKFLGGILIIIPGILLIALGFRCFSSRFKINKKLITFSVTTWITSLMVVIFIAVFMMMDYSENVEYSQEKSFELKSDTLSIAFNTDAPKDKYRYEWFNGNFKNIQEVDGALHLPVNTENIQIRESQDDLVRVEIKYESKGRNIETAKKNLDQITYSYRLEKDNSLLLDDYLAIPKGAKYRKQDVNIIVFLPKGKILKVKGIKPLTFKEKNETKRFFDTEENLYSFIENRAICLSCKKEDEKNFDDGVYFDDNDNQVIINKNIISIKSGKDSIHINYGRE